MKFWLLGYLPYGIRQASGVRMGILELGRRCTFHIALTGAIRSALRLRNSKKPPGI